MINECVACWCDVSKEEPETVCLYLAASAVVESQQSRYCWACANCEAAEHYRRWQRNVDQADCASALRRMIAKGPPTTFADVDTSLHPQPDAQLVRGDGIFTRSAHLDGAPATAEARDELWAMLREREKELPETAEPEESDVFLLKV